MKAKHFVFPFVFLFISACGHKDEPTEKHAQAEIAVQPSSPDIGSLMQRLAVDAKEYHNSIESLKASSTEFEGNQSYTTSRSLLEASEKLTQTAKKLLSTLDELDSSLTNVQKLDRVRNNKEALDAAVSLSSKIRAERQDMAQKVPAFESSTEQMRLAFSQVSEDEKSRKDAANQYDNLMLLKTNKNLIINAVKNGSNFNSIENFE